MDFISTLGVVVRRWKIVVPALLATAIVAIVLATSVAGEYGATASAVMLTPPPSAAQAVNAPLLAEVVMDGEVRRTIAKETGSTQYTVDATFEDIIRVDAVARNRKAAVATASAVLDQLGRELEAQYDLRGVPNAQRRSIDVTNRPRTARREDVEGGGRRFIAQGSASLQGASADASQVASTMATYVLLTQVMDSQGFRESVVDAGGSADFDLVAINTDEIPAPFHIEVIGTNPSEVLQTIDIVIDQADRELDRLQSLVYGDASPSIDIEMLVDPQQAQLVSRGLLRSLAVVIFLGTTAAVGLALLVERWSAIVASLKTEGPHTGRSAQQGQEHDDIEKIFGELAEPRSSAPLSTAEGRRATKSARDVVRHGYGRSVGSGLGRRRT